MQSVICSLQSVVRSLQSAVCSLQSGVCSLQSAVCSLQSANVRHRLFGGTQIETNKEEFSAECHGVDWFQNYR